MALLGLIGRVAYLQTYGRQQTILKAERQHHQTQPLPARRGSIFDRNGTSDRLHDPEQRRFHRSEVHAGALPGRGHMGADRHAICPSWRRCLGSISLGLASMISDDSEERFIKITDYVPDETVEKIRGLEDARASG